MSWADAENDPKPMSEEKDADVEEGKEEGKKGQEEGKEPEDSRMSEAQEKGLVKHPLETDRNCLKFPDLLFGIAWVACYFTMVVLAIHYGSDAGDADYGSSKKKRGLENLLHIFIIALFFALIVSQILVMSFFMAFIAMITCFIHIIAIAGFITYKNSRHASDDEIAIPVICMLIIFFWTQQVFKYILIASTAATGHAWWNGRYPELSNHPAVNALFRSLTYNLGAIAFGALFVSLIEAILLMVSYIRRKAREYPGGYCCNCLLGCCTCCLGCCAAVLDYMNKYAFIYVGIYGYSFLYAGRQVVELFSKHGISFVGADFFIDLVFFINAIIIGVVTAMFGVLLARHGPDGWTNNVSDPETTSGVACGLGGLFVANIVFAVIDGANKATMVLFAENPHLLEITHPVDHKRLEASWAVLSKELKGESDA